MGHAVIVSLCLVSFDRTALGGSGFRPETHERRRCAAHERVDENPADYCTVTATLAVCDSEALVAVTAIV
jgi:hypothetical protein